MNQSFLRYIWLIYESCYLTGHKHFHPCKTKHLQTIFYVSWIYICIPKIKLIYHFLTWSIIVSRILQYEWLKAFFYLNQIKIYKPFFVFLDSITACQKSNLNIIFSYRYKTDLRILQSDWLGEFFTMFNLKSTSQLLRFLIVSSSILTKDIAS